jgi:hypothetical protein
MAYLSSKTSQAANRTATQVIVRLGLWISFALFPLFLCPSVPGQTVTDKMVASVTNGARVTPDLIAIQI